MSRFATIWNDEVRYLAIDCILEPKFVHIWDSSVRLTPEERDYIEEVSRKYRDIKLMYKIAYMVSEVDNAIRDGRYLTAQSIVSDMYYRINSRSYFSTVFGSDDSSREWKNIAAFRDGLAKLL